jgi:uncharacterized membrane protein
MEGGCLAVLSFGLALAAFIVALNVSGNARLLKQQIEALKAQISALERELRKGRGEEGEEEAAAPVWEPPVVPATPAVMAEAIPPMPRAAEAGGATLRTPPPPPVEPPQPVIEPVPMPRATEPGGATLRTPPPPVEPPPPNEPPPPPPSRPFDWESLVGVKLFSWIAGVALVLAAIFFFKYSLDHGWISPMFRAIVGLLTGTALIVVCEMRVARDYAWTANAMLGAGIAILYATLYSIHALWHLLPAGVVFAMMLVVTAVAVMLSIRRDSPFIALLGMMGGFATPALLSTGENRPIGLFSYLLLLNAGLAWVAYRKRWVSLTVGSLIFTFVYQWAWIGKFLTASQLPLAATIFAVFAVVGSIGLWMRGAAEGDLQQKRFERLSMVAAILPIAFAIFGAAVPAYGARYNTLFAFLLFMAAGLATIARLRGPEWLHVLGGAGVLLTFAVWMAISYRSAAWPGVLAWVAAFVVLYLSGGVLLRGKADHTAAILLFVFPILAAREPATADPAILFATLFVLFAAISAYAVKYGRGGVYLIAAFLSIIAQAVWSARHLTSGTLTAALLIYLAFGLLILGVPVMARRAGRPISSEGVSITILASLAVLFFLTGESVAPAAIWGLALLLLILQTGLFNEARHGVKAAAAIGAVVGWLVLASWWNAAPLAESLLAALFLIAMYGLLLMTGAVWTARAGEGGPGIAHLAVAGHLFLMFVASRDELSIPPWPLFAVLALLNVGAGIAALALRRGSLMVAVAIASQIVAAVWAGQASAPPWPNVALALVLAIAAFCVIWYAITRRRFSEDEAAGFANAAVVSLLLGHFAAIVAGQSSDIPLFWPLLLTHSVLAIVLLSIAWVTERHVLATILVPVLALATALHDERDPGLQLLFAAVMYAIVLAYPLLLGRRAGRDLQPYLAAVLASVPFFFFARAALIDLGYQNVIGILPIAQALTMLVLLVRLLRVEAPGEREMGRLALVAAAALAFITLAVPLQLDRQWITIAWALEGAALVWLYRRIPHRGLLLWAAALLGVVFVRLVANPAVFDYYPRSATPILNWYLYTYAVAAAAFFVTARLLPRDYRRSIAAASSAGTILLFVLLNIEIADFYSTGQTVTFNLLSASLAQDLTYTIGWALFAVGMLVAGITFSSRAARIAALSLLSVTILKCFLHDLGRLGGLYRVGSLLGLAISLVLVGLLLQKFVLRRPAEGTT